MSVHVQIGGEGRDLVLLHGWALHGGAWSECVDELQARFRVHAVDLPGHGYSAALASPAFDDAVDALAAAIPAGAIVCGWSLGGLFAQRLALTHPDRVAALVLVSSTPCFAERADWAHGMKASTLEEFAAGLANDRDATLERFVGLNALHGARGRAAARALQARLAAHGTPAGAALQDSLEWLRGTDLRADTPKLAQATLVVHGVRDALTPIGAGRWLARELPHARLSELPDAAHLPFFTHRRQFLDTLESFVG